MMAKAAIGGVIGGPSVSAKTKQEHIKDKEIKNKQALQENSLVALAATRPDLYTPTTLPFFGE